MLTFCVVPRRLRRSSLKLMFTGSGCHHVCWGGLGICGGWFVSFYPNDNSLGGILLLRISFIINSTVVM